MSIRLMICDDHPAVRAGLETLLEGSDIGVAVQAETCDEAVRLAEKGKPDVVLLDIRLGGDDGLEALRKIKRNHPALPVLIFSIADDLNDMAHAHKLGADGYIVKTIKQNDLQEIIRRAVAKKKTWSIPQIRKIKSRAGAQAAETRKPFPLSKREGQVLSRLISGSSSNEEIAEYLGIDVETVKQYVKNILRKLHVEDRTQAALWALRNNYTDSAS
jgi:DNA-binding NarL/FixJ family response regulator